MLMSCGQICTDQSKFRFRLNEAGSVMNMHLRDGFSANQDGFSRLRLTFFQTADQSLRHSKAGIVVGVTLVFWHSAIQYLAVAGICVDVIFRNLTD
jgi:hypothetical protein